MAQKKSNQAKSNPSRNSQKGKNSNTRPGSRPNSRGRQGWTPPPKSKAPLFGGIAGGIVVVVIVVVLIVINLTSGSTPNKVDQPASAQLVSAVTSVPVGIYNAIGTGSGNVSGPPTKISGAPLTLNTKPEILYIGAEWCPYCGAERWALVTSLSRFGTFTGLETGFSSSTDSYPSTPTFGFQSITYTSSYLSFVAVETQDVNHNSLMSLSSQESDLFKKYDSQGSIPFIDIGNKWFSAANYNPQVLQGLTHDDIAGTLSLPTNQTAESILGSANYLSATFCNIDGDRPASVCNSSGVQAAAKTLGTAKSTSNNKNTSKLK